MFERLHLPSLGGAAEWLNSEPLGLRPFHVDIPDEALEDLRGRIAATNWPEKETVADQASSMPRASPSPGSFGWYRALDTTIAQDEQRKTQRLTMPVLAIGGEASFGEHVGEAVQAVADDVQSVVIPGVGHFVAEEAPDEMLAALTAFLAPFRDGQAAAQDPTPHADATSGR